MGKNLLLSSVAVMASVSSLFADPVVVASLADAMANEDGTEVTVSGKVLVSQVATSFFGRQFYFQDASAALVMGEFWMEPVEAAIAAGDSVSNLTFSYGSNNGSELHSFTVLSSENAVEPELVTVKELAANKTYFENRYIKIENVHVDNVTYDLGETEGVVTFLQSGTTGHQDGDSLVIDYSSPTGEYAKAPYFADMTGYGEFNPVLDDSWNIVGYSPAIFVSGQTDIVESARMAYTFTTLAALKQAQAVYDEDYKAPTMYYVGKALVHSSVVSPFGSNYYMQDETAGAQFVADELGYTVNPSVGDSISYIAGPFGNRAFEGAACTYTVASSNNEVVAEVATLSGMAANQTYFNGRLVKVEGLAIDNVDCQEGMFDYMNGITCGDNTVILLGAEVLSQSPVPAKFNLTGVYAIEGEDVMLLVRSASDLEVINGVSSVVNDAKLVSAAGVVSAQGADITVYSVKGAVVASASDAVSLSALASGVYVAKAVFADGSVKTVKIVK